MAMIQIGDKWNLSELAGPPLRVVDRATGHHPARGRCRDRRIAAAAKRRWPPGPAPMRSRDGGWPSAKPANGTLQQRNHLQQFDPIADAELLPALLRCE